MGRRDRGSREDRGDRGSGGSRPPPSEAALTEVEHHLAELTDRLVDEGWTRADARQEAERRFGSPERWRREIETGLRQEERRVERRRMMADLWQDVRYGVRGLRRSPLFAATVVLTVALGIGVNLSLYSLVDAVLLDPLPVDRPERLVSVRHGDGSAPAIEGASHPDWQALREGSRGLAELAGFATLEMGIRSGARTERVLGSAVSGGYFGSLGLRPRAGRLLGPADVEADGAPVAVVSDRLWARLWERSPGAVGGSLEIGGRSFTVVGVAPRGFTGTSLAEPADVWIPLPRIQDVVPDGSIYGGEQPWTNPHFPWLTLVGRLEADAAPGAVAERLTAAARATREAREDDPDVVVELVPLQRAAVRAERDTLLRLLSFLGAVVAATLVLACVNVTGLLLARATSRTREMAIRRSIGASRLRLLRQLLVESLVLTTLAAALAPAVAAGVNRLLLSFTLPGAVALETLDLAPGRRELLLAGLLAAACGIAVGLVPALWASRSGALRSGAGAAGGGRMLRGLLAVQVTLSAVLLVGAGLFARSVQAGLAVDTGLSPDRVTAVSFSLSAQGYPSSEAAELATRLVDRLGARPGVTAAAAASHVPPAPSAMAFRVLPADAVDDPRPRPRISVNVVGGDYFELLGVALLEGRTLTPDDRAGGERVAVLSRSAARSLWPDGEPAGPLGSLGRELHLMPGLPAMRVVGVVEDVLAHGVGEEPPPYAYLPLAQYAGVGFATEGSVLVRTREGVDAPALLRQEIRALDPSLPLFRLREVDRQMLEILAPQRFAGRLAGLLALVALLVSAVGIQGAVSYAVASRRREIGIRVALGAVPRRVVTTVAGREWGAALGGLALGLGLAAWGARFTGSLLFGIEPVDPVTFAGAALVLAAVAGLAALRPVLRALSVDPREALSEE